MSGSVFAVILMAVYLYRLRSPHRPRRKKRKKPRLNRLNKIIFSLCHLRFFSSFPAMLALRLAVDSFQHGGSFYLAFNLEYGKILPV